ncbi:hypothetical protein [Yeosuana marina]|uniref:hypothetical protein n=1 Tax=Yeosuana marina TaxID=1565536 RepID=UPI00142199BD|nr:hypothetical protein [Yeosuana marina]
MAIPTQQEIKAQILTEKANYISLDTLNSTSKVSIFGIWAGIVATVIWTLYVFFDLFTQEINTKIKEQKKYSLLWYRNRALEFRYGQQIINDEYTDDGYTEEEIEAMKVIKRAAVIELELNNRKHLYIKVATEDENGDLAPVPNEVKAALEVYYSDPEHGVKAAGTKIIIYTDEADDLKLNIDFFYNPLVLDENGSRIDGTSNTPVQDVVRDYLKNLKFNGEFNIAKLEDLLQDVDGCSNREAYIRLCEANYLTPSAFIAISDSYVANSGYMVVTDYNLNINFIPKPEVL